MFAKHDDVVMPSAEGMDAMAEKPRLCSPQDLEVMRSRMALQAAFDKAEPGVFMVTEWSAGADRPWLRVEARWNGQEIDEDKLDIAEMVKPLNVSFGGFHDGMFMWSVEAPPADWMPEDDHEEEPMADMGPEPLPAAMPVVTPPADKAGSPMPEPDNPEPKPVMPAPVIRPEDHKN